MLPQWIERTDQQPVACIRHLLDIRRIGLRWWTGIPIQHNTRLPVHMGCKPMAILCCLPHSNCRAEIGVKTMKRILMNNTGTGGALDVDAEQLAILQYTNTPDPATKLSPAMMVFGQPIRDFILILHKGTSHTTHGMKH